MNEIVNNFLQLGGHKFMPEMHLIKSVVALIPGFTDHCGPFTKHKESIQKFK